MMKTPIYGKVRHVSNHQPNFVISIVIHNCYINSLEYHIASGNDQQFAIENGR